MNLTFLLIILLETDKKVRHQCLSSSETAIVIFPLFSTTHPPTGLWRKYGSPVIFGRLSPTQIVSRLGLIPTRGALGSVIIESFPRAPRRAPDTEHILLQRAEGGGEHPAVLPIPVGTPPTLRHLLALLQQQWLTRHSHLSMPWYLLYALPLGPLL